MNFTPEFQTCIDDWRNDDERNNAFHAKMTAWTDLDSILKAHRDFVEQEQWGFGDRAFHSVWRLLVDQMPSTFDFLEIGVFKGQVISLVALIAQTIGKTAKITGVTTLENTPDVRCKYPSGDYLAWIHGIYKRFNVPFGNTKLVVGKSNDQHVLREIGGMDFDMIYVDGNHDYAIVLQDLDNFSKRVRVGGFLVIDDASIGRLNVGSCWSGLEDVAKAVAERIDTDPKFKFLFAVGHINIFYRVCD